MSWLNLNDSFNNIKGQLTNLANNVLSETDSAGINDSGSDLEQLRQLCANQQVEISRLKKINEELTVSQKLSNVSLNNNDDGSDGQEETSSTSNWSWVIPPEKDNNQSTIVQQLEKRIEDLENDKRDLIKNLELLDNEYQVNQEKLINIKDKLQDDYNKLEEDYEEIKLKYDKYGENSIKQNKDLQIEIDRLKIDNKVLTKNNQTLKKLLEEDSTKHADEFDKIKEKLQLSESENKILLNEIQKLTESVQRYEKQREIDADNFQKLSTILEGYELKVQSLKDELVEQQTTRINDKIDDDHNDDDNNHRQIVEFKEQVENLQCQLQNSCKEQHQRYVNILIKIIKNIENDYENFDITNNHNDDDELMIEFINQINHIIKIINNLRQKNQNLEKDLHNLAQEKTNLLQEKNHEIEKLLQNSEILSQEVVTKTQTIQDYEHECNELIKNNDLLINELENYKNNMNNTSNNSSSNNSGLLQTISETNEDNLLLLEQQLDNATRKIEELEMIIAQQENTIIEESFNEELTRNLEKLTCENQELKDAISKLRNSLEKSKIDLENIEYQYAELNVHQETLKEEIENQKNRIDELSESNRNLKKSNTELEHTNENCRSELNEIKERLLIEEDSKRQLENQVRNLTEKLQNSKMTETSLKLQYDTVNKELANLVDTKLSLETNLKQLENELERYKNHQNPQIAESEEHGDLLKEIEALKAIEKQHLDCCSKLQQQIDELETAKNELTSVVLQKHEENVTYHHEIQRLSQILTNELEKSRNYEVEIQQLKNNDLIDKFTDQMSFLREKCDVLTKNLLDEQNDKQQLQKQFAEKEQILNKNLERLQQHLIEIEEHYTQELLITEEKNAVLQNKVSEIEEREKNSSTMYTSVSIRANQHVETLQNQLQMITNQRDELRKRISDAEDNANRQAAALANLQFVLEQFQKEKENDVFKETERIRRQITTEKKIQDDLRNEIANLHLQLDESKQGLLAASRLSDQLEQSKQIITNLKGEVTRLKEELLKSGENLKQLSSNTDGKVDKSLIKNLIIGFITSNNNLNKDQMQIVKIIATVLDFNQQDHDKINLNKNQLAGGGWLGSMLSPQQSSTAQGMSQESLSQAFVRFLENESKPRFIPSLLNNNDEIAASRKNSTTSRQSPIVLSEVVLPTFADFAQNRNSSSILKDVLKDTS